MKGELAMKFKKWICTVLFAFLLGLVLCGAAMAESDEQAETADVDAMMEQIADALQGSDVSNSIKAMAVEYNYDSESHSGDTETDAYVIDSKEDFAAFVLNVNSGLEPAGKWYKLDIDLLISKNEGFANWDPIGLKNNTFKGHFNGNGRTIMIASRRDENQASASGAGLFGQVETKGGYAIKDLKVDGALGGSSTGGIVVLLSSGAVQNCDFKGTVAAFNASGVGIAGGVAGGIAVGMEGGSITNCRVSADSKISAAGIAAGGIVGVKSGGSVENCNSDATIECNGYKGGIIGIADSRSGVSGNKFTGADKEIGFVESEDIPKTYRRSGGSGGGCSVGFGLAAIVGAALLIAKKR